MQVLNAARAFYVDFFLAHADKLSERVSYYSQKHLEMRERASSPNELTTWAERQPAATTEHPHPWPGWNFRERFPDMPLVYRRSVIKDAIGKVRAYLSHRRTWEQTGKRKGKPGLPGANNHPSLYQGTIELSVGEAEQHERFVRLNVYTGAGWRWVNYPVRSSRSFERRHSEAGWGQQHPSLGLRKKSAELHFAQTKEIQAKKVNESKADPHLVTVAVDLNVKNLAVITVRQDGKIIETIFVPHRALDHPPYRPLNPLPTQHVLS